MNRSITKQDQKVKVAHSLIISQEAGDKLEEISDDTEFSLVRDKKGQLFTRIRQPQIRKAGKWINLRFSTWGSLTKRSDDLPKNQKRECYILKAVTRAEAVRWLINENIPSEFKTDFMKLLSA